jgi:hypothetical protein
MGHVNVVETFRDPEVRKYFLGILKSPLQDEDKLEKFIAFFDLQNRLEERIAALGRNRDMANPDEFAEIASAAAQQIGVWQPRQILERTSDCVVRAGGRILRCQHSDGGWGFLPESSNLWGTAHCVTALSLLEAVDNLPLPIPDFRERVKQGTAWIERWFGTQGSRADASTYDASMAVRCFHRIGRADFRAVSSCLERLAAAQNPDGGWDWSFPEDRPPESRSSEVGATGMVLEALGSAISPEQFRAEVDKGIRWLASVQNPDGSWNEVFKDEPRLRGSINKTCDGLSGLNVGRIYGLYDLFRPQIERGVRWISEQEKLIGDGAWGYEGLLTADIISTCIVVETLLKIEEVSLPLLSANAQWLIENQRRDPSVLEDGEWVGGDTFRITLALTDYLARIRNSPLFRESIQRPFRERASRERERAGAANRGAGSQ